MKLAPRGIWEPAPAEEAPSPLPVPQREQGTCFHCNAAIPEGVAIEEAGGGKTVGFCCHGCRGAYLLISGAGLGDFYRRREWGEPGVARQAFQEAFRDGYLARFVHPAQNGSAIDIIIDGIRCASCAWVNEKVLERLDGVLEARVNYATGRARVVFDPASITPAAIFSRVAAIGYAPRPYTADAARDSAQREQRDLLYRFGTAFFLTMQLMAYSFALYAGYLQGIDARMKVYLQFFSLLVTTPVIFYCGWPFLAGAWRGVRNRAPNMELLIAIGALSSYGYSVYQMRYGGEVYFETAAMIVTLILAGRLLENSAKRRAAGGVERLLGLCAGEVQRCKEDGVETVDPAELRVGDVILIRPGERFPVDGEIVEGSTDVDESPATGEPLPVSKSVGESVVAGSGNLTGAVRVNCRREASDSFIARVARLVEEAQGRRAPIQGVADRASAFFVPAVLCLAAATFTWHYANGGAFAATLMTALAVVVIACPCALGLATPTAIIAGTGAAARGGVIFKGGDVLERLSRVTIAVFDKTGTLTCGAPEVVDVIPEPGVEPNELLRLAAAVESGALHPVAKAILQRAREVAVTFPVARAVKTVPGGGVTGKVAAGKGTGSAGACPLAVTVGSDSFLATLGIPVPLSRSAPTPGTMQVCVARDGQFAGWILLKDRMRADAPELVSHFNRRGIETLLLSGDRQDSAEQTAGLVGVSAARGGFSPADKAAEIERLRRDGATVLMVGDGINDAPALSAADVGCAVAGGTDIAIDTSDLVLVKPDLARLAAAHLLAQRTMSVVRQNLVWAFLYNCVGIPLAMTGKLTPIYAAAAMALSSLCVVGNSLRLLRVRHG